MPGVVSRAVTPHMIGMPPTRFNGGNRSISIGYLNTMTESAMGSGRTSGVAMWITLM